MSQENVDNLREFVEAWGRLSDERDWAATDLSVLDPDVVYEDTTLPDHAGETYRGYGGVARAVERWAEAYEVLTIELERIVGSGDRLVSLHRTHAKARHTGIEFEGSVAYAWTFRDGKVIQFRSFLDPQEALEAMGLSE